MNYKLISELWHGFLRGSFGRSGSSTGDYVGRKRGMTEAVEGPSKKVRSGRQEQPDDIDTGLRRLLGPTAQWKSEQQRDIMAKILGLQDNGVRSELLIAVLPIGGGKSVFFLLPAVLNEARREESPPSTRYVDSLDDLVYSGKAAGLNVLDWLVYSGKAAALNVLDWLVYLSEAADLRVIKPVGIR